MRLLRSYLLASIAASAVFTVALAALERETNTGNILAGWSVFVPFSLMFTAVLAPAGAYLLRRMGRGGFLSYALAGLCLGWLSTLVLFHNPLSLVHPMALAFGGAGLAAGLGFRAGYGPPPIENRSQPD